MKKSLFFLACLILITPFLLNAQEKIDFKNREQELLERVGEDENFLGPYRDRLSKEEIREIINMDIDPFFNVEKFI